ncbi:hypothetical protein N7491_008159 [Penicillium cf. griseofulvum]|uniref:Uncharacterized protein n=1 Tax=Penicillium cf. griseofulvum TaxID=2972120 RepID=A0A9W9J4U5_9EURO|nr:hypothetical protein N7472_008811 [Penicillium cf. griseofulvum]KAJ5427717.1 hypothetical protein N7491_008159 [Penicillium cf. griseofulvum]KAJ5431917.1 hypothetical protein N7445_008415 [Penicillium cf. griseofulvum]
MKNRLAGESGSLQRPTKARPSIETGRAASYHIFPSRDLNKSQDQIPFPDVADNSHSPVNLKKRSSMASSMAMHDITPGEQMWNSEQQLMNASERNKSSEALDSRPHKSKSIKPKVHIKPILRKLSRDDAPSTSIDLSRSSTDQEGLGIYMNFERERPRSGSLTGVTFKRTPSGLHNRSTSGTSQFSNGSGSTASKPGSQYVHPMRQTPRAYTPPLGQSYEESSHDSDELAESPDSEPASIQETRASSGPALPRLSLQIQDDSFTRLPGISQTNVTSRPSFGYSRETDGTASPMSRTSLDFVFRSRTRTSTDPISRAATVQAARQAFEDKEAAKNRRLEKQQIKAEERGSRRRLKRHMSEDPESPVQSREEISEKPRRSVHESQEPSASWKSQSKSTWVLFMTWLRTRVFKLRRKIKKLR